MKNNSGTVGENLFEQEMKRQGYIVNRVSNNPEYFNKDVDFVIKSPTSGETKTFEVKWDYRMNKTGNLYLEIINGHSEGGRGWWEFCQADYLVYGDAHTQTFYVFSLLELRDVVNGISKEIGQCGQDSIGYLVPLIRLKNIYKIL